MVAMIPMTLGVQGTLEGAMAVQAFATMLLSQYVAILMERGLQRRAGMPVQGAVWAPAKAMPAHASTVTPHSPTDVEVAAP